MSRSDSILICMAIVELPVPHVPVRKRNGRCDICGTEVWIARSSPRTARCRCSKCAAETFEPSTKWEPLTKAQKAELKIKIGN